MWLGALTPPAYQWLLFDAKLTLPPVLFVKGSRDRCCLAMMDILIGICSSKYINYASPCLERGLLFI